MQTEVAQLFSDQLGTHSCSYAFVMGGCSTTLFWSMDRLGAAAQENERLPGEAQLWMLYLPFIWILAGGPLHVAWSDFITLQLQKKRNPWCDRAVNLFGALLLLLQIAAMFVFVGLPYEVMNFGASAELDFLFRRFLFVLGVMLPLAVFLWNVPALRARTRRP